MFLKNLAQEFTSWSRTNPLAVPVHTNSRTYSATQTQERITCATVHYTVMPASLALDVK